MRHKYISKLNIPNPISVAGPRENPLSQRGIMEYIWKKGINH